MAEVFFNGQAGRLEGRFHQSENPRAPLVLVLHPNPAQGGSMNNRVTYALFQAFVDMGFSVLRFNYRGVGHSQGDIDGTGAGELMDAISALDWLQMGLDSESRQCWIAGYSFGAWIGAQVLMRRPDIKGFVFVTPPVGKNDFSFLNPCPSSGLIIQGGADTIINENSVVMLAEQLSGNQMVDVKYHSIPTADHLYTNELKSLYGAVTSIVPTVRAREPKNVLKKNAAIPNDDFGE